MDFFHLQEQMINQDLLPNFDASENLHLQKPNIGTEYDVGSTDYVTTHHALLRPFAKTEHVRFDAQNNYDYARDTDLLSVALNNISKPANVSKR